MPQSPDPLLHPEPPKGLAVVARRCGAVNLSDGTQICRITEGGYLDEYEHWWARSTRWFVMRPSAPSFRTLREALAYCGVGVRS